MSNEQTIGYRLSQQQQRLWRSRWRSGAEAAALRARIRLNGPLDIERLQEGFSRIVRRHEALRTRIELLPGTTQPVQVVDEAGALIKLRDLGRSTGEGLSALEEVESRTFRDLQGTALHAELVRLSVECHYLVIAASPFCADVASLQNFVRELAACYGAGGSEPSSMPEPVQYADYAAWQEDVLAAVPAPAARYWRIHQSSDASPMPLALEKPTIDAASFDPTIATRFLSGEQVRSARTVAKTCNISIEAILLAAWTALLHRHSRLFEIDLRLLSDGRSEPVAGAIGAYLLQLPLRASVKLGETYAEFSKRLHSTLGDHRHWQDYAPNAASPAGWPDRSFGFGYATMDAAFHVRGVSMKLEWSDSIPAQFGLHLQCYADAGQIVLEFHYDRALYTSIAVDRLIEQWTTLLDNALRAPETPIGGLALLGEDEQRFLASQWNVSAIARDEDARLHDLFNSQLARMPTATAVVFGGRSLSYAELSARANQLAHRLRDFGVGPETIVGVYLERSIEMVVALLGVLEAGGAYLPLDPDYPSERIAHMIEDARPLLVLTRERLRDLAPKSVVTHCLDTDWAWTESGRRDPPSVRVDPQNLAYVIYTSGSTGKPKGVAITHETAWRSTSTRHRCYGEPVRGFLLLSSFSFDSSVAGVFWTLSSGGALCLPTDDELQDAGRLAQLIERHRLSHLLCLPSLYALLLEQEPASLSSLRVAIVAGEACPSSVPTTHHARLPGARLYNEYGPTEATVWSTVAELAMEQSALRPTSIGRPIEGASVLLLDEKLELVPVGVAGEVYIGGGGVARGYLRRSELTAERFIPDPLGGSGGRLYRTGDLARYRPDGEIEFLGRIDHQVKIRGFRIELREIEAALSRMPSVRAAVVIAREDVPGNKQLVAYVVGEGRGAQADSHLRSALARELPHYMVPSVFVRLDALPTMSNGKVDRKALPVPDVGARAKSRYLAPRTAIEAILCQVWADVLGLERVGVEDNFFELGGHSLLAITLVERLRQHGVKTDARQLFAEPTPALLAAATGRSSEIVAPPNLIPSNCDRIVPEMLSLATLTQADIDRIVVGIPDGASNVQDIYPLAPLQEGILFHHLIVPRGDPFLASTLLAFDTRSRLDDFIASLQAVMARHDILRTSFAWDGLPEPMQVVWRKASIMIEEALLDPSDGEVEDQLRMRFDPRHYRIDLGHAPLVRGFISHDPREDRWLLLILGHHLVLDHTTLDICAQEAKAYFLGGADRLPAPLPFRDFVAQARLGVCRAEHEAFFTAMLGDVTEPTAPFDLTDVQGDGSDIDEARLELDTALAQRLREQARAFGVSAASLCHLAWALALARASGSDDVVFGTVLFGRMLGGAGAGRALGLFINTLPLRVRVGAGGVAEGLRGVHGLLTDMIRHEHASLALAQRCSGVAPPTPLFSALFNYRHGAALDASSDYMSNWEGVTTVYAEERNNYPLTLSVDEFGDGFQLTAQTQSCVDPERVCRFMQAAMERVVEALETAPDTAMRSIDVLPDTERRRLLLDWNATATPYSAERCIHHLFEEQAARTPKAIAVEFEDESLTYAELSDWAAGLAARLRKAGVGPDIIVGVCMERSLEMVVALLGILRAGGAYLPLDPDDPGERSAYMIEDARLRLIVTQEHLRGRLPDGIEALSIDRSVASMEGCGGSRGARVLSRNLAYVIYTSGSTGKPKGVAVEHGGVVNRLEWMQARYRLTNSDVVLQKTPYGFDVSVWEFFWPLSVGARLVLARPGAHRDPHALRETIDRQGVTTAHFVPSLLRALLDVGDLSSSRTLRRAICSGEALSADLRDRFYGSGCRAELHNLYGPTEASIDVTAHACPRGEAERRVPIGRPISNMRIYILDSDSRPVPVGVAGELCIGGVGLARGYLGRAGLTAERFIPDPFGGDGERLYRTGDLARYREDGEIEFLGRIDHQVKIRGVRIELGEIEAALSRIRGVRAAVTVAREDAGGDKRLVAYLVAEAHADLAVARLRAALERELPEYMIPSAFIWLDALPLTANGKVDRKNLPAVGPEARTQSRRIAPRSVTEWIILREFRDILGIESIGVQDNFFHVGGNSLSGVKLIERIRRTLCSGLPVKAIFQAPTVAQLTDWISNETDQDHSPLVLMRRGPDSAPPLYCIHPSGGSLIRYQALADRLGGSRSVYGIQSRGLLDPSYRADSIEEMAADYVRLIRRQRRSGPYLLLGWSMGGFIAATMAAYLEEQGESVAFLGLLDSRAAADDARLSATALDYVEQFAAIEGKKVEEALGAPDREHLIRVSHAMSDRDRYVYAGLWGQERGLWRDVSPDLFDFLYAEMENSSRLMRDMRMPNVCAPVHVWWAEQTLGGQSPPPFDWRACSEGPVVTQALDVSHHDIVEDVRVLDQIERVLQTVSERFDAVRVPA